MEKFYNFMAFFATLVKLPWKIIKGIATLGSEYIERYFDYNVNLPEKAATGSFVTEVLIVSAGIVAMWLYNGYDHPGVWLVTFIICSTYWLYRSMVKGARKRRGWK